MVILNAYIIVPEQFQHKLNYFLFFQIFEIIFIICVEFLTKLRIYKISIVKFEWQTLKIKNLKVKQFKHTSLSHKLKMNVIVIFYNHYLFKMSKCKNQVLKLRFKI
jgi:hypothetical protein